MEGQGEEGAEAPVYIYANADVEVQSTESGLEGALSQAQVLEVNTATGRALVKLTSFPLDSPEWQPWAQLRPEPPAPPGGEHWLVGLRVGDAVELLHDDMWWEVRIGEINRARITQDVLFLVRSTQYGDEHEVPGYELRPRWEWLADSQQWLMQHNGDRWAASSCSP